MPTLNTLPYFLPHSVYFTCGPWRGNRSSVQDRSSLLVFHCIIDKGLRAVPGNPCCKALAGDFGTRGKNRKRGRLTYCSNSDKLPRSQAPLGPAGKSSIEGNDGLCVCQLINKAQQGKISAEQEPCTITSQRESSPGIL